MNVESQFADDSLLAAGSHYGAMRNVVRFDALALFESIYPPQMVVQRHGHERASFTLLISGDYVEEYRHKRIACRRASVLFRPAAELHANRMGGDGARCVIVEMPETWCKRMHEGGITLDEPRQCSDTLGVLRRMWRELENPDELSGLALEALTMELACAMQRGPQHAPRAPKWLRGVRERVEAEFAMLPSLEHLAREAGVHPAHMARSFRERYGATIGELARSARMEFCINELIEGKRELSEIAAAAGFASQAHFTTAFRKRTGMTPAEFRRSRKMHRA